MNKMKCLMICVAALFFVCCDSSNGAGTTENENTATAFKLGVCVGSPFDDVFDAENGDALARKIFTAADNVESASEDLPKAYIVQDSAGNDQVMILKADDYCGVDASLGYRRSGDTLTIAYVEIHGATACVCYSDHWFYLPAKYRDIKYFRFDGIVYEIDPGPAPEPSKPEEREQPINIPPAEYDPETGDSVLVIEL